ncbi:MAG: putative ABC transporter permease [Spirochaetaceae bacterium]|jgi:uncharacterized membrane protein|nr:putative ABC transporter permease [Spirochaetaceae bacterium]
MFSFEHIIFAFFCLSFLGWIAETINESITRKKFVNKGFFKSPFVPCQGLGGLGAYFLGSLFREDPELVFLSGFIAATATEYLTAILLEKCFSVKCWDYRTYPHIRWCHFQGRIALTTSLFFGFATMFVVYIFWDICMYLANRIGRYLWVLDALMITVFFADIFCTCKKYLNYKRKGVKVKGSYAVFSDAQDFE